MQTFTPGSRPLGDGCTASLRRLSLCPNHESAVQIMSSCRCEPRRRRTFATSTQPPPCLAHERITACDDIPAPRHPFLEELRLERFACGSPLATQRAPYGFPAAWRRSGRLARSGSTPPRAACLPRGRDPRQCLPPRGNHWPSGTDHQGSCLQTEDHQIGARIDRLRS